MFSFLIEEYKRSDKSKQGILNLSLTFAILKPLNISKSANLALFLLIFWKTLQQNRLTLDIWLRKKRDMQAAYVFLKSIHKQFGQHRVIVTDKAPSLGSAFRKLQSVGLYPKTEHRTVKYLNNLIEQTIDLLNDEINFIKVSVQPLPRLRAWRSFEEYIKRTEEMERSSAFRCLLKSRY